MKAAGALRLVREELTTTERALALVLSRMVGQPRARIYCHRLCLLIGGIYDVPGPFYAGSDHDSVNKELTRHWQRARKRDGLVPHEDVERFFPARILPALADVIANGPAEFVESIVIHLTEVATGLDDDGEQLLNDDGSPMQTLGDVAIAHRIEAARRFARELIELRKQSKRHELGGLLDEWTADNLPDFPTPKTLGAEARRLDRSAPPLAFYRRCLRETTARIDRQMRWSGQRRHNGMFTRLRNRMIVMLCGLGLRAGTIRRLCVGDYIPDFELMPGLVVPALRLRHLKQLDVVRIFPIPIEFARWIEQYLDYVRERGYEPDPDQPLLLPKNRMHWTPSWRLGRTMVYLAVVRTLAPFCKGRIYSPHTLRHLAEQYAVRAGSDWLREHDADKDTLPRPSGVGMPIAAQTFADSMLDHALQDMADRYGDVNNEQARRWWRWVVVQGVYDYYCGSRGAPKGIDVDAVRQAKERLQDLRADAAKRNGQITRLEQARDSVEQQKIERRRAAIREADALDEAARFRVQLQLDELNDQITYISRQIERELRELPALEVEIEHAKEALRAAATTLVPIADDAEPVLSVLDFDETPDEDEPNVDEQPILRRTFDPNEFHWALGGHTVISAEQLRRYLRGQSAWQRLFDDDGTGKPKGVYRPTPHKCTISFDDLPLERYPAEVVERFERLMRQPPQRPQSKAA